MKMDKTGLLMVAGAALVLLAVVKKSTGTAGAATKNGQGAIGANASSYWGNLFANGVPALSIGSMLPGVKTAGALGTTLPGGLTLFGNGTFDAGSTYVDPGQLTYNTQTGAVQESPFSGMYGVLAPATYGF